MTTYKIKTNKREGTATVSVYDNDKLTARYRYLAGRDEIEGMDDWTDGDIKDFMRHNDGIIIK